MSDTKNLKSNIAYNMLLQVATLVLPFVVQPYISRVLTPAGTGIYSYTNSIVSYFTIVAGFGFATYGTRQIAFVRGDKKELAETFTSLFILKLFTTLIALAAYGVFLLVAPDTYKTFFVIQTLLLLGVALDISWLFFGLEEFKPTVIRSLTVRLLVILCTFIFVRTVDDLWIYVLITAAGNVFGNLILWAGISGRTSFVRVTLKKVFSFAKPCAVVFISYIAIEIYTVLDKSMLGLLTDEVQVGLYSYGEMFAKASLGVIGAVSTVLLPHMSDLKENGSSDQFTARFNVTISAIAMIGTGATFGMMGIAKEFIPWMLGDAYEGSIILLMLLSPLALIISTSNIISKTYLLPSKKEKIVNISVIAGACTNLLCNLILIPRFAGLGACIGTLIAECVVTVISYVAAREAVNAKGYWTEMLKFVGAGLVMFFAVRFIGGLMGAGIITTVIQVAVGVCVYAIMLVVLRCSLVSGIVGKLLKRVKRS